jgi:hypothetical protein
VAMALTIFYSWQDKRDRAYNRYFIQDCIKEAVKQIQKELKNEAPVIYFDRGGVEGVPGSPNIPTTIQGKIKDSDIFIGDVSYVSYVDTDTPNGKRTFWDKVRGRNEFIQEGQSNANVSEELGIAKGDYRGDLRVITVMNTVYGTADQLNFDSKQSRYPLVYHLNKENIREKKAQKDGLIIGLKERMLLIIRTAQERQKEYFKPFINWQFWQTTSSFPFAFVRTNYVDELYKELESHFSQEKSVFRLCGLSGIGKTRLLFEYFSQADQKFVLQSGRLLYYDLSGQSETGITTTIRELVSKQENKILVIDNCPIEYHNELCKILLADPSKLNLLTISTDPEEKSALFGPFNQTKLFILENEKCKETVQHILDQNFSEYEEQEKGLLKDFSSGISFVAALMAENQERGKHQPGTLTERVLIRKLLGPFYDDPINLSVIQACCLFSKFGYFDDLRYQAEAIAQSTDMCSLDHPNDDPADSPELRKMRFIAACEKLQERRLLERRGRTFSFRPSPLAVSMAEEWWQSCGVAKFQKILPVLQSAKLVEAFCEQFRYLKHIAHAQSIVKDLCKDGGVFRSAEVLNTEEGSRLFRSFVYVNPVACAESLYATFGQMNADAARQIQKGRRNLVWALEQLCFRKETFEPSFKVMAIFASGENENIANNATGQFRQLFHIHLAGTEASLTERFKIIQWCFKGNDALKELGLVALGSALTNAHFSRMGGAEDQGDVQPLKDYIPSGSEVYQYWKSVIEILEDFAINDKSFSQRAIEILMNSFYGICIQGAGEIILNSIEKLLSAQLIDKLELRSQVLSVLKSHRIFNSDLLKRLEALLSSLEPNSFSDKFKVLVVSPSPEEYRTDGEQLGVALERKIDELGKEYIAKGLEQFFSIDRLVKETLREGYKFGKAVAQQLGRTEKLPFVKRVLSRLVEIPESERNNVFVLGFIDHINDEELTNELFDYTIENASLNYLSFLIARSGKLPLKEILRLVELIKKENTLVEQFTCFDYGWGLRHLTSKEVKELLDEIAALNNVGKMIRFLIIAHWIYNDKQLSSVFKDYVKKIVIEDSRVILDVMTNSMDIYNWSHVVVELINDEDPNDSSFAKLMMAIIIEQVKEEKAYYLKRTELYQITEAVSAKYYAVAWDAIAFAFNNEDEFLAYYHLKDLLGSHTMFQNSAPGILFKNADEHINFILDWAKENSEKAWWIAEMVPLYNGHPGSSDQWHPYAKQLIDLLGDNDRFLSELGARMGSYSWTGSVVPKLESDLKLYQSLLDHPVERVRNWANAHINELTGRITWEKNRDEDGIWHS